MYWQRKQRNVVEFWLLEEAERTRAKMKIAFITQPLDEVYPTIGGYSSISIVSYQLALRLARAGHEVIIYAKRGHEQPTEEVDENGILYQRVPTKIEEILHRPLKFFDRLGIFRANKRPFFASNLYYPGYALQIAHDLKQKRPDIIHIHNFSQYVPLIRKFNPNAKIILHMHCEWLSQLDRSIIRRRMEQTDLVLGCSEYIINKVRLRFPQYADRCKTLFNGVALDDFNDLGKSNRNGGEKILFVGRISPEKGVHILLDAFREVLSRRPKAQLNIVGPSGVVPYDFIVALSDDDNVSRLASFYSGKVRKKDHYADYLEEQLSPAERKQVSFLGFVSHSSVVDYYRDADVFVFTSEWDEPFGIPIVEAMACGLPVAAAKGGAVPEIVKDGKTGLLVNRSDAPALAQAVVQLLENGELRDSMGKAGRYRASELFTWDRSTGQLLEYYKNLLDD